MSRYRYYDNEPNPIPYIVSYVIGTGLLIGSLLAVPHKKQCDLSKTYHVHLYTREVEDAVIEKWLQNEDDTLYYTKQDQILPATLLDIKAYNTLADHDLFDGRENIDFINYQIKKNRDYMQFYYSYQDTYEEKDENGNTVTKTKNYFGWTTDPWHRGVTGWVQVYHKRYYSYNLVSNGNEFELQRSEAVDDIREIINEYPYMSESTNTVVTEDFNFYPHELPYLVLEDFDPFYTPTVENNPLEKDTEIKNRVKIYK